MTFDHRIKTVKVTGSEVTLTYNVKSPRELEG
jgi:hypothetical protein